jgi:hypothetical protein
MGEARKLKSEIDRTLKKVQEGQDDFESLWKQARLGMGLAVKEDNALKHATNTGSMVAWSA